MKGLRAGDICVLIDDEQFSGRLYRR
jgi:hypothetical protein